MQLDKHTNRLPIPLTSHHTNAVTVNTVGKPKQTG